MKNPGESANGPGAAGGNPPGGPTLHEPIPLLDIEDDEDPTSFLVDFDAPAVETPEPGLEPPSIEPDFELLPADPRAERLPEQSGPEPVSAKLDALGSEPCPDDATTAPATNPEQGRTTPTVEAVRSRPRKEADEGVPRPGGENLPARPTSWCGQCGVKHPRGDCPGEVLAREPERHGWKAVVQTPTGKKVHGILLAPAGDGWRARIMTYPRTLWVVPGGIRTIKFLAPEPDLAELAAIEFLKEHCAKRNHEIVDDPALMADPEPIELEQTDFVDETESKRRKPRTVLVRFGADKPSRNGNTADLSEKGMFIATSEVFATGTNLRILLELAGARIPLRGVVKWTRGSAAPGRPGGMGIELIRPPAFYIQYIHRLP